VTSAHFDLALWLSALPLLLVAATISWLVSLPLRNVAVVDPLWSLMLFAAGVVYALDTDPRAPRLSLTLWLAAIWAMRLAAYVTARNAGRGEPRRYRELRERHDPHFSWKSLYRVFGLQALLAWVVSLPLLGAFASNAPVGPLDYAGILLWIVGFVVESGADWQLARFRADPANADGVLRRGFWRFTRHPNYFGECCVWWGMYLVASSAGAWWAFPGPVLLTWLLLRVSGVPATEKDIGKRRPQYADYVLKTNAFLPARPRT
jgi:steroid 5-alpha reductase family enzyme